MKLKIYTDGACSGNPGKGGWAAIILDDSNQSNISGIPWFVINDSYAISGAQLPEVFVQIFDLVRQDELSEQLVPE